MQVDRGAFAPGAGRDHRARMIAPHRGTDIDRRRFLKFGSVMVFLPLVNLPVWSRCLPRRSPRTGFLALAWVFSRPGKFLWI